MWPILLKVLSIIGIVLLCILGVVLLLLLLILLCPITYKLTGSAHDKKYDFEVKIKYLFGLVRAGYHYPEPGNLYAKVLWFTLYDSDAGKDDSDENADNSNQEISPEENQFENLSDNISDNISDNQDRKNSESKSKEKSKEKFKEKFNTKKSKDDGKKKILNPMYHIKKTWENFRYKVVVKVQMLIKDIKYYISLWEHQDTQALFAKIKKRGLKMLKIIAPKKGNVDIHFGTGSPDTTGQIYGVYCSIFTKWPKTFHVVPDFENSIFEGDLLVKGHFNLMSLAIQALPLVLSKQLKLTKARIDAHMDKREIANLKATKKHEKILNSLEEEYS